MNGHRTRCTGCCLSTTLSCAAFLASCCSIAAMATCPDLNIQMGLVSQNDILQGKHFNVDDIKQKTYDVWKADQKNPDYMLAVIHGANEGFQAKISSKKGSYLIRKFTDKMLQNIEEAKCQCLSKIIDEIQEELHEDGKQQITPGYNNTLYLKFKRNE